MKSAQTRQRVLDYMMSVKRPVTVTDLAKHCATYDGRKYISDLKKSGHIIKDSWINVENRYGEKVRIKEYWYEQQA